MIKKFLVAVLAAGMVSLASAHAALLGSFDEVIVGNLTAEGVFEVRAGYSDPGDFFTPTFLLFDVSPMIGGGMVTADSGAAFDLYAAMLTNGVDDILYFEGFIDAGGGDTVRAQFANNESFQFMSSPFLVNGIDFQGSLIERVVLTVTEASITPDGNDMFNHTLAFKVEIFGSPVPLPAALPLFLAGLAGIGAAARRRSKTA